MATRKSNLKYDRMLDLYRRLTDGEVINKEKAAIEYQVDERTIQRDIDDLRGFFSNQLVRHGIDIRVIYDRMKKGFRLESTGNDKLTNAELFIIIKILLESRSLVSEEMNPILNKLLDSGGSVSEKRKMADLVGNDRYHYIGPRHEMKLVNKIWELRGAVYEHRKLDMKYCRFDGKITQRKLKPVGIMFSKYYFYLAGFTGENDQIYSGCPTVYRADWIQEYEILEERFVIPYKDHFAEGEFHKRVSFIYSGPLTNVKFVYKGSDINAVMDCLPAASYKQLDNKKYLVKAEVYGTTGIEMWLRSQGEDVEILDLEKMQEKICEV